MPMRSQQGFSLIELLIVVMLIATLLAIGLLSFTEYKQRTLQKEITRQLEAELWNVRMSARVEQQPIRVDLTSARCLAYADANGNGTYDSSVDRLVVDISLNTQLVEIEPVSPLVLPKTVVFMASGKPDIADTLKFKVMRVGEPGTQYCITLFTTGITRVEVSGNSGVSWIRAW